MSSPTQNAFTIMMNSRQGEKRKRGDEDEKDEEDEGEEGDNEDARYKLCLKARYRSAFKAKFGPIIRANGSNISLGGHSGTCWLVTGYVAQNKGGPRASYQVYLDGRNLKVTVGAAKAAVMMRLILDAEKAGFHADILWPFQQGDEASHVCHSPNCVRPDHIAMESRVVNQSRNDCCAQIQCLQCETHLDACTHHPRCIWLSKATSCSVCASM